MEFYSAGSETASGRLDRALLAAEGGLTIARFSIAFGMSSTPRIRASRSRPVGAFSLM
jgi:hypothetical protein